MPTLEVRLVVPHMATPTLTGSAGSACGVVPSSLSIKVHVVEWFREGTRASPGPATA